MAYSGATGMMPTGTMATGALGDAPAPSLPPTVGGETAYLRYRVLDPVSGAVLIDDLSHLHQSTWDVIGFQPGATGRSAVGSFSIKLFPPGSDGYKNAKQQYDLLNYGQRVEGYLGDIIAGDPRFTGLIKAISKSFSDYTLSGDDSLTLLSAARSGRTEVFSGTTDALVKYALKGFDMAFGDDFSLGLGNFTNNGGWAATKDGTQSVIQAGSSGDGLLYTTASFANSYYADCSIEIPFRMICDGASGSSAEISIMAAVADSSNFVLGQAALRFISTSRYELDFNIFQKSAGTYVLKSRVQGAFAVPNNSLPGHLEFKGFQVDAVTYLWRLTINGSDVGCFWKQTVASGSPTGGVGIRSNKGSAVNPIYVSGSPVGLVFWSKTNWFQNGRISTGTQSVNQAIPDTPNIDLLQLAATTESGEYRKNPKGGLNQDTVDFGLTVGSDFSAMIRFEQGGNIVDASIEPNAEDFGSMLQSPASPSVGSAGWTRWAPISIIQQFGGRIISTAAPRISDILAHRFFAQQVASLSGNPGKAKRVTVRRDEWADRVRELDVIELHIPDFGINHARAKVVGYLFKEGEGTTEFLLDQYPRRTERVPKLDRLIATVENLASRSEEVTATDPTKPGAVVRESRNVLPVNPYKFRITMASNQTLNNGVSAFGNIDTVSFPTSFDTANGLDSTNHWWVVPVSGFYFLTIKGNIVVPAGVKWITMTVGIAQNGTTIGQGTQTNAGDFTGTAGQVTATAYDVIQSDVFYLNAGDHIQMQVVQSNSAASNCTLQGGGSPPNTYISGHLVSA